MVKSSLGSLSAVMSNSLAYVPILQFFTVSACGYRAPNEKPGTLARLVWFSPQSNQGFVDKLNLLPTAGISFVDLPSSFSPRYSIFHWNRSCSAPFLLFACSKVFHFPLFLSRPKNQITGYIGINGCFSKLVLGFNILFFEFKISKSQDG